MDLGSIKPKGTPLTALNLKPVEESHKFFNGGVAEVEEIIGITKQIAALTVSSSVGNWIVETCINCCQPYCANHKDKMHPPLISAGLIADPNTIQALKTHPDFSPVFRIVIKQVSELKAPLLKKSTVQSALSGLQQIVGVAIKKQAEKTDETIRVFSDQQYEMLTQFRNRSLRDHEALIRILYKAEEPSEFEDGSDAGKKALSPTKSADQTGSKDMRLSTPAGRPNTHPTNAEVVVSGRRAAGRSNSLFSPTSSVAASYDAEGVFNLEGMDDFTLEQAASDGESDTDHDDSGSHDEGIDLRRKKGAHMNVAKSLPVNVPVFPSGGLQLHPVEIQPDDLERQDTMDIAASIKALARSVHGDAVFGDLPRPRSRLTLMDSELSSKLETVASCLEGNKENSTRDIDDNFDFYGSRHLSTSPAEAVYGDSPSDRTEDMAIEEANELNWDEDGSLMAPSGVIPLPPSSGCDDITVPTRPETPNFNPDLEQLFNTDHNTDVLESTLPGVCGLCNLGNTCFMNSGLQCLLNTPALVQVFMTHAKDKDSVSSETIATHFANLLQKVWSGKYSKVKPTEFHQALANQHPQFKDYRQHDCQEFLALLLGSLHELLNTASAKSHVSDLSADPMTPRSVCEEGSATVAEAVEPDSTSQMALSLGVRCEVSSSSSRSSESSIGASQMRMRPLPEDILPFKSAPTSLLWETMESISETCDGLSGSEGAQDCNQISMDVSNSNLIAEESLKRDSKVVNVAAALNNAQPCLYKDIIKDAKTSNVNVLVAESTANNEIVFDSDKFLKHENTRRSCENMNLTEFHNFEEKTISVKRIKDTNKLQGSKDTSHYGSLDSTDFYNCHTKRFKLEDSLDKEKNVRMEYERNLQDDEKSLDDDGGEFSGAVAMHCASAAAAAAILDDDLEAEKQWEKHLGLNQSVIVDSFQGQFKSTVVCSECRYVSSTYEPFMYLSVPLPHAMEEQLCVTFVPASANPPTKFLLTLNKQDKVLQIKEQLRSLMEVSGPMSLELAIVLHHHIARILDENQLIRSISLSDPDRSIYAFEISDEVICAAGFGDSNCDTYSPEPLDLTPEQVNLYDKAVQLNNLDTPCRKQDADSKISSFTNNLQTTNPISSILSRSCGDGDAEAQSVNDKSDDPKTCTVCLEEMDKQLKNHKGCSCFLCDPCMENTMKHYDDQKSGKMECPVCSVLVSPATDFVNADEGRDPRASLRMLKVPVVFRQDCSDVDGRNRERDEHLFGHPHLVKVANRLAGALLYKLVRKLVPYHSNFSIVLVDGQGYHCSRCLYTSGCKGCLVNPEESVSLQSGDNLAVRFTLPVIEITAIHHRSLLALRKQEQLSLYDCLDAFCESETLDEQNPWYCPTCERNQCATKTLSVWRYPDFLIVYLKRFVFHEYTSVKLDNKVSFPLKDLSLAPSSIHPGLTRRYDLYACVNHLGGASAGHYTAYSKNPHTGEWHLYNDDTVTVQKPEESDYSHAYILFYQKQGDAGIQPASSMLSSFLGTANMKANMDQLLIDLECSDANLRASRKEFTHFII